MLPDRPRSRALEWSILFAVLVQAVLVAYQYGRVVERVDALVHRIDRIERLLDPGTTPKSPPH